jgi:hypothetical protein
VLWLNPEQRVPKPSGQSHGLCGQRLEQKAPSLRPGAGSLWVSVQPLDLGSQGQGLPELEEVLTFSPFLSGRAGGPQAAEC